MSMPYLHSARRCVALRAPRLPATPSSVGETAPVLRQEVSVTCCDPAWKIPVPTCFSHSGLQHQCPRAPHQTAQSGSGAPAPLLPYAQGFLNTEQNALMFARALQRDRGSYGCFRPRSILDPVMRSSDCLGHRSYEIPDSWHRPDIQIAAPNLRAGA